MKNPDAILTWNISEISKALKIDENSAKEYFQDGRRVSFILERRIAGEIIGATLAPSEGAAYDLVDKDQKKWEVRSISHSGIYFCPSYMVGSGRHFEEVGFLEKLDEIEGYIVTNIASFPQVPIKIITSDQVRKWWEEKMLGTTTKITHSKMIALINGMDGKKQTQFLKK